MNIDSIDNNNQEERVNAVGVYNPFIEPLFIGFSTDNNINSNGNG
jgi:hypothetical protein